MSQKIIKPNISQSFMKEYMSYFSHEQGCGEAFKRKYYYREETEPSDEAMAGQYFEYLATGYAKDPLNPPKPRIANVGKKNEGIAKPFENARQSAELFKMMMAFHGFKIVEVGTYWKHGDVSGLLDILAEKDGQPCIIDLKETGLFDDKWTDYGWHTESLPMKPKLMLQPIHYKYMAREILGILDIPFYFFVFSLKDPLMAKIIKVNIDPDKLDFHGNVDIPKVRNWRDYWYENPDELKPRPSYSRCLACPFEKDCRFKQVIPEIVEIDY